MKDKTRSFGILYQAGDRRVRHRLLQVRVRQVRRQARVEGEAAFAVPPGTSQADAQTLAGQQMPTMMAKLKEDGVTTIIDVLDSRYGLAAALEGGDRVPSTSPSG